MICPHCKKPVSRTISEADKAKAKQLLQAGYSMRDISVLLEGRISFSSVSRLMQKQNKSKRKEPTK